MPLQKQLHIIPIADLYMITMFVCLIWGLGPKDPLAYPRRGFSNTVPLYDIGIFKVNLEFRISGVTWKTKYQLVLETGN